MDQDETPRNDPLEMTGNVQGFKLPMGCLMTSVLILLPILTMVLGLVRANNFNDGLLAVLIPAVWMGIIAVAHMISQRST